MISLYEQLKRAKKGEVIWTNLPARNATSAASRLKRRVKTMRCVVATAGELSVLGSILRITVVS